MLAPVDRYSCDIHGYLEVAGRQLPIARLHGTAVGLQEAVDLPPSEATIVMFYDGEMRRTPVLLPEGSRSAWIRIPYTRATANQS
jgi:hypothetical protein